MNAGNGLAVVAALAVLYGALVWAGTWLTRSREARERAARVERFERHRRTITEVKR